MLILITIDECQLGKQTKGEYEFMNSKLHYKMFKAGKKWAFASIAAASLGIIALDANATNVHADSTDNDATDTVDDSTTTSPVSEASVTLTKTSLPASSAASASVASSATSAVTSTATSSAVSKSATNSVVTSSSAKSAISSSASEKTVSSTAKSVANSSSVVKNTSSSSTKNSSAAVSVVAHSNSSAASSTASSKAAIKTSSAASVSSSAVSKTSSAATTSKNKAVDKKSTSKDYTIDYTHQLSDDEGSDQQTKNNVIIAHATGVYAPAENVAIFEKREWDSSESYVQYIVGDGGKVYAVGQEGYVAWGAGEWANENAPVQVELAQTYSDSQFKKDYQTYVNLLRDSAKKWNIPTSLDSSEYRGIKSHVWITNHVWGNHVDPYGYLSTHGISQTQFAHDLQYGFGSSSSDSSNNTSNDSNKNNANNSNKNDSNSNKNNSSKINVGDKVTIKTSAKHWATGQTIYSAVKGKTYKVIQVNGSRLLLEKVLSWINTSDVTTASSSNHSNSNKNNGNKNNSNKNDSNKNNSTANIKVGSKVTIKSSAKHWATGQTIYNAVKGKTYKVIQVNGNRLLLDKVISWINKGDVTVPGSSSANHSSSSNSSKNNSNKNNSNKNTNTNSIKVGSKVTIKTSAKHWATGQSIYSAVKGKTYKVISWINKGDVTVPGSSSSNQSSSNKGNSSNSNKNNSSNKIGVGSKVTINKNAKHWATGQSIYNPVKGKTYKVIQVNGSKLLLDKVISWINKADVTLAGSKSNSGSSNKNNAASMHNVNVHLTNKHWTTAQTNFVNGIAADIVNVCNSNKLYASVAMAQAVLESGYGTSSLAQEAHNLFGIKADSTWKGATYTKSTKEVINGRTVTINASFRKYASIKDSIADYAKKLESRAQYANAFAPKSANYVASIKAIKAGGYATSTTYVGSIINCINSNGFFKLDGLSKALHL